MPNKNENEHIYKFAARDIKKMVLMDYFMVSSECILIEPDSNIGGDHSTYETKHVPCGISAYTVGPKDQGQERYVSFTGEGCVFKFINHAISECERVFNNRAQIQPIKFRNPATKDFHDMRSTCSICELEIDRPEDKVADHCHTTG